MKKIFVVMLLTLALLFGVVAVRASGLSFTNFEPAGFVPGESVHNHQPDGTEASPPIAFGNNCVQAWFVPRIDTDEEVVDVNALFPSHGKVWRFSNGIDDGTLGQAPHSANSGEIHGETGAYNDAGCGLVTTSNYYAEFQFRSATGGSQVGYRISANANSGDTRHAYTRIKDDGAGFDIEFFDTVNGCDFNLTTLDLNLSYTDWHTVGIEVFFEDGLASGIAGSAGAEGNDQVNLYVDNQLVHSGTTWESCVGARSVDRVLFDHPETNAAFLDGGLYIDNVLVTDLCPVGNCLFDSEGPVTTNIVATPNPAAVGSSVTVTANVDDTTTGGSNIGFANYEILDSFDAVVDSGSMSPVDMFDSPVEDVSKSINAPTTAGIYDLCAYGTDVVGNVGEPECIMFVVYDPSGGFVTGGGWFDSQAGSYNGAGSAIRVDGNPDDGWVFNAEPPYVTPAGFTGAAASIGDGSIHVDPITNAGGNAAKFILRYVPDTEILLSDLNEFSIDFLIDPAGTNFSHNQFYINLYAKTPDPYDGTSWFDCRFDYIATAGSTTNWTALAFQDTTVATHVDDRIAGVCPSSLSGMPAGSTLLFVSVNLGDTSANDTGVGGYFDNAQLSVSGGTKVWDFEESLTGKATFGFVSKYKKGASVPEGNTEFQFKAGDLYFQSTSYEWLVVTGSNYAKFKGAGTINGNLDPNGNAYKFMLWAGDNDPDTFHIKIWWEVTDGTEHVVYDNGTDQPIGGGSIVVHKAK